jgi:hypothetical protein
MVVSKKQVSKKKVRKQMPQQKGDKVLHPFVDPVTGDPANYSSVYGPIADGTAPLPVGQPIAVVGARVNHSPVIGLATFNYGNMNANLVSITVIISAIDIFYMIPSGLSGGKCVGFTFQNARELLTLNAGDYLVNWSLTVDSAAGSNQQIRGAVMINGVAQAGTAARADVDSGNPQAVAGSGIITLAVNDLVQLSLANHVSTNNMLVYNCTLSLVQVAYQ